MQRVLGGLMHRKEINTITVEMFASDSVSVTSNEGYSFDAFGGKKTKNVYRLSGSESDELSGGAAAAESK